MKHIVYPALRLLWFLLYFSLFPIVLILGIPIFLWEWEFPGVKTLWNEWNPKPYSDGNIDEVKVGEEHFYYQTIFDWLIQKRSYSIKKKKPVVER